MIADNEHDRDTWLKALKKVIRGDDPAAVTAAEKEEIEQAEYKKNQERQARFSKGAARAKQHHAAVVTLAKAKNPASTSAGVVQIQHLQSCFEVVSRPTDPQAEEVRSESYSSHRPYEL